MLKEALVTFSKLHKNSWLSQRERIPTSTPILRAHMNTARRPLLAKNILDIYRIFLEEMSFFYAGVLGCSQPKLDGILSLCEILEWLGLKNKKNKFSPKPPPQDGNMWIFKHFWFELTPVVSNCNWENYLEQFWWYYKRGHEVLTCEPLRSIGFFKVFWTFPAMPCQRFANKCQKVQKGLPHFGEGIDALPKISAFCWTPHMYSCVWFATETSHWPQAGKQTEQGGRKKTAKRRPAMGLNLQLHYLSSQTVCLQPPRQPPPIKCLGQLQEAIISCLCSVKWQVLHLYFLGALPAFHYSLSSHLWLPWECLPAAVKSWRMRTAGPTRFQWLSWI